MTARRKRLKKLMQSIGIQRNDFETELENRKAWARAYNDEHNVTNIILSQLVYDPSKKYMKKVNKSLNELGISVKNCDREFKSFGDIISEISNKWNDLTD